ncbi:PA14 domain-containing protein [Emticicia sp. SJ17W-69]|uniref:Ig-like domain-containing protein n=1 Tax=Emticicia sp. SJ17W-69 TaxID=3421657 RepID=UPI003EB8B13D
MYFFTINTYTSHIFFAAKRCFTWLTYSHKFVKAPLFFVLFLIKYQVFSQNPITGNQGFQVLTEGNFTSTGSHHIHGPLAVGGNLVINSSVGEINMDATGSYVFPGDGSTTTGLLVKGGITWTAGYLRVLNSKYIHIGSSTGSLSGDNGTNSATQVYPTSTAYNNAKRIEGTIDQTPSPAVFQTIGFDFTTLFNTYRTKASTMAASANNVQLYNTSNVAISGNNVTSSQSVRINSLITGINYLDLTTTSLTNISELVFNEQPSASQILIISVPISANYTWNNVNMTGLGGSTNGPYILWNFYGTTSYNLTINQASLVVGTVFAPNMNVIKTGTGDIDGNLIAKTAQLGTGEIHNYQFEGNLSCVAPIIAASSNSPVVTGSPLNLVSGSNSGTSYAWTGPSSFTSASQNPTLSSATTAMSGIYTVTVSVTGGCTATATTSVTVSSSTTGVCLTANSSFENGIFANFTTSNTNINGVLTTYGGSQAVYLTGDPGGNNIPNLPLPNYTFDTGYWVDATTNGGLGAKDGNRLFAFPSDAGEGRCLFPNSGMGFTHATNSCYRVCLWVAQFDPTNPNANVSSEYRFEYEDSYGSTDPGITSNYSITPSSISESGSFNSISWNLPASTNVKTTTGVTYTGAAGQVVDWKTLNWQQICLNFTAYVDISRLKIYNSSGNPYNGIALDGFCITQTCIVCSNVTAGGTIGSNQTICTSGNPAAFTSSVAASGGSGTIQYQWEKSIDGGITWVDIVGATSATYDEPNTVTITTQYRRKAMSSTCTTYGATSNTITVTIVSSNAATASSNSPITAGGTINLTSIGGGTYAWSGPSSFTSTQQNPSLSSATTAMAGVYTVTVTNSGCTSTATTNVVVNVAFSCSGGCTSSNMVVNSHFENDMSGWTASNGQLTIGGGGTYGDFLEVNVGDLTGTYTAYQDVAFGANAPYKFTAYVAKHGVNNLPKMYLEFYNGTTYLSKTADFNVTKNYDGTFQLASFEGNTPANTTKIRIVGWTQNNALKFDNLSLVGCTTCFLMTPASSSICVGQSATLTVSNCTGTVTWNTGATGTTITVNPTTTTTYTATCNNTTNLLTNPGFETGSLSSWTNWNYTTITSTASEKYNGTYGAKITASSAGGGFAQNYSAVAGESFTLKAWAKVSSTTPWSGFGVKFLNSSGTSLSDVSTEVNTTTFQEFTVNNTAPAGTTTVQIYAWTDPSTILYIDNFTLIKSSDVTTATATVTVNTAPTITATGDTECVGGTITLGTTGGGTYSWVGPASFTSTLQNPTRASATSGMAGIYTVTVTAANGCTASATANVIINSGTTPTATVVSTGCTGSTGSITVTNLPDGYSTNINGGAWTQYKNSYVDLAAGTYSIGYQGGGCNIYANFTVATSTDNPLLSLAKTDPTCSTTGSITVTGSGGTTGLGDATYQLWYGITGTSVSNLTSNANYPNSPSLSTFVGIAEGYENSIDNFGGKISGYIVPPTTGTYYFWVASDDYSEFWGSGDANPANKTLLASVSGYTGYREWNKYASQKSVAVSLNAGQIYYFEVLYKEGGGGDNISLGWSKPGEATTAPSEVIPGKYLRPNIASSTTTPVYQYKLNSGAFQTSNTFTGLSAGTYTVTIQDAGGCTATTSITLAVTGGITAPTGTGASRCGTGTLTLSASGCTGTYNWYSATTGGTSLGTGSTYTTPSISATTTYYVDCTVSTCISTRASVIATINATPSAPTGTGASRCGTGTVSLSASGCPGTYNWYATSTGGTSLGTGTTYTTPSISATTTYYVDCTVSTCTGTRASVVATINTPPSAPIGTGGSLCGTGTVTLSASGCTGTYNWYSASTGGTSLGTGSTYTTPSISSTTTYYVDCTVSTCISTRASVVATINTTPSAPTGTGTSLCGTGTATLSASGCTGTYNWYSASTGGTSLGTGSTYSTPNISSTTTYYVDCTVGACLSTRTSVVATVNVTPSVPTGTGGSRCGTGTVSLSASGCAGTYNWYAASTGGTSLGTGTTYTTPSISATTTYYVDCNVSGCISSRASAVATINTQIDPTGGGSRCGIGTVVLTGSGCSGTYNWYNVASGGTSLGSSATYTTPSLSTTTNYYVSCTIGSCTGNRVVATATINPVPTATASSNSPIIVGGTLNLFSDGGDTYAWSGPNSFYSVQQNISMESVVSTMAGIYSVTVTSNGCSATATTSVVMNNYDPGDIDCSLVSTLNFANPTLISGTALADNAKYRFSNVTSGTDAIVTIVSRTHSDIAIVDFDIPAASYGGYDAAFQPMIDYNWINSNGTFDTPGEKSITFKFDFVVAGTNTPKSIPNLLATGLDIDGSTDEVREFIQAGGYQSYQVQTPSSLTLSGALKAKGPLTTYTGINELALDAMISYGYINSSSITVTYGGDWNGSTAGFGDTAPGNSDEKRLNSLYFKCYNFNTTVCALPLAAPTTTGATRCGNGTVTLTASGCTGNYYWYTASTGGLAVGIGSSFTTPSLSTTTTYYVECNAVGCTSPRTSAVATVNANPVVTITGDTECVGKTINLASTGGGTYSWSGPNSFTSSVQNPILTNAIASMAGVYTLTVTNANACTTTATTNVIVNSLPTLTVTGDTECVGGTINLASTGGGTYAWSGPNAFSSALQNPIITNATTAMAGIYTLTVTNASGCTATITTNVIVNTIPSAPTTTSNGRCGTGTVTLSASGCSGTYTWYSAATGGTNLGTGATYTTPSISTTTNYYVDCTVNNCSSSTRSTAIATVASAISINTSPTSFSECIGGTGSLSVIASGGSPSLTYQWQSSSDNVTFTNISGQTSTVYVPSSSSAGTNYYKVIVSASSTGCSSVTSSVAIVNIIAAPTVSVTASNGTICAGGTSILTANVVGGTGTTSYQWQLSSDNISFTNISGATSVSYTTPALSSTTYYKVIITQTGNGCGSVTSTASTITVVAAPTISVSASNGTICTGGTSILTANVVGGTGTTSYQWQLSSDNVNFSNISGATSVTYTTSALSSTTYYKVIITQTGNGCGSVTSSASTITVVAAPTVSVSASNGTICTGGTSVLTANVVGGTGTTSYQWQLSSDNISFTNISGATSVTYTTSALSSTTYYKVIITQTGNGCGSVTSSASTITVVAAPTVSVTASNGAICTGGTSILTANVVGGTGTTSYQWQLSSDNISFTNISGATSVTYTTPSLSSTTYYKVIITQTGNGCGSVTSTASTITVVAPPTVSVSASNGTICIGGTSILTANVVGGSGTTTYQWQSSSDNVSFTNISGATSVTYTTSALSSTTYYKVIITQTGNGCGSVTSAASTITVLPAPTVSVTVSNGTICTGGTSILTANVVGGSGTTTYQWQSSSDNISFSNISGATSVTYTTSTLSSTTYYKVIITQTGNGCGSVTSSASTITVVAAPTVSVTASNGTICAGGTSVLTATVVGGTGTTTYQWQSSSDNVSFSNISGATSVTYITPVLSSTTYYKVIITQTGSGCGSVTSSASTITVLPDPTVSVTVSNGTICTGGTSILTANVVGGTGTTTYQWQSSNDNVSFTNISGATSVTYTTPSLSSTTYYKVIITQTGNGCGSVTSTASTITVLPDPTVSVTASNGTICVSGTSVLTANVVGGTGTTTYQWQSSSDNVSFSNISGATSVTYTTSTLSSTTYYKVIITQTGNGCGSVTSTASTITVVAAPTVSVSASNGTICAGGTSVLTANVVGGTGTTTYQWQSSSDNVSFSNISGATSVTYTTSALSSTTYYKVIITQTGNGCGSVTSTASTITVVAAPTVSVSASNGTICAGGTSVLTATVVGGTGTTTYQWQSSNDNVSFTNISGATSVTYTTPSLSSTTYYKVIITQTGNGCGSVTSSASTITVVAAPTVSVTASNGTICTGGTSILTANVVGGTGTTTYQWQSSSDNISFSNISGATSVTYTTSTLSSTTYYKVIITQTGNGCGSVTSTASTITVVAAPTVSVSASNGTICIGGTSVLTANVVGGTGTTTYQWQSSNDNVSFTNISGATSVTYTTPSLSSTTYYKVIITQTGNGCGSVTSTASTITVLPDPTVSVTASNGTICVSGTSVLTANVVGGTGTTTYQWQSSSDNVSFSNISGATSVTYTTSTLSSTTYYKVIITQTGNGCGSVTSSASTITVVAAPTVSVTASNGTICAGGTSVLTATVVGGTGTTTYQWQSSSDNVSFTNISGATSVSYTTSSLSSTTYYKVIITQTGNGCGSVTSAASTIIVNAFPSAPVTTSANRCGTGTVVLTTSGCVGGTVSWYNSATGGSAFATGLSYTTPSLTAPSSVSYYVECSTNGCVSTSRNIVTATANIIPTATAISNYPILGGTLNLSATGGDTYSWSGPNNFTSTLQEESIAPVTASMQGTYTVTVTVNGCTATATTSMTISSSNNPGGIDCSLIPTLSFTNPTLISGTAGADNAQYRFSNVTGGTDAIVTIVSRTHSDITVVDLDIPASTYGGYDAAMQPIIDYNWINSNGTFDASGERSVTFKIDFVVSGTTTPKVIPNVVATGLDIDGSGTEVREFIQSSGFQSHEVQNPTSLTLSGSLKAKGPLTTYTGINELAYDAMISYAYINTSSITITYGADWNGSTSGFADNTNPTLSDERRLNSLYFKCYDLNNSTCDLVLAPPTPNAGNRCGTGTVTLSASGCTGTYTWYNVSTGGASIATGSSFITPSISSSTTYYVECTAVGCTSSRASVIATVYVIPSAPTVTGGSNCGTGSVTLSASGCSGGTVQWYSSQTGTTLLASGTSFSVASLANSTVYFAACTNSNGCVSTSRNYGVATINPIPQAELSSVNPTCLGMQSVSNGKLLLNKFEGSDLFSYNVGSTYNSSSATAFTSIPTNGELLTGISDPGTSISYTVRIKNAENCTIDRTLTIVKQCGVCPVSYCEPPTNIVKTK